MMGLILSSRSRPAIVVLGALLLAGALWQYDARQVERLFPARVHSNDFKHMWLGARLVRLGVSPYEETNLFALAQENNLGGINPYVYLPFTAQVMMPLGALPFDEAARAWFFLNHAMLLLAIALAAWHTAGRAQWPWGLWLTAGGILLAALMMPVMRQMTAGQMNCALALLFVGILIAGERKIHWLLGFLIAFATLFKLAPGLFGLYLLWKRAWRPLIWGVGFGVILLLLSTLHTGLGMQLEFFPLLKDMRIGHSTWAHHGMAFHCDPANQAMGSFLLHIFASDHAWNLNTLAADPNAPLIQPWVDLGVAWANRLTLLFTLALLAVIVYATRRACRDLRPETWRAEWALIVLGTLLIPSLAWDHYVVQLVPVVVVGVGSVFALSAGVRPWRLTLLAGWGVAAALLAWPISHWDPGLRSGLGLGVMSIRLWGMLAILGLTLVWHRWARQSAGETGVEPGVE